MINVIIETILKVTLISSLVDVISSVFKLQNYIRLVSNFFIMITLISPFTNINIDNIKFDEELEKFFYDDNSAEIELNTSFRGKSNSSDKLNYENNINNNNDYKKAEYLFYKDVINISVVEEEYSNLVLKYLRENNIKVCDVRVKVNDDFKSIKSVEITLDNKINEDKDINNDINNDIKEDIATILDIDKKKINIRK